MKRVSTRNWAAVRRIRDDGHEYIDLCSLSTNREHCEKLAVETDGKTGDLWAKNNPVVRFSLIDLNEV